MSFLFGMMLGGVLGVAIMCLLAMSGEDEE